MSWAPLPCPTCARPCRCEGAAPFPPGSDAVYAVSWRCDPCDYRGLDVCPAGPLIPTAETCLNCGSPRTDAICDACGVDSVDLDAKIAEICPDRSALASQARRCASEGLLRLAFHLLDARLREHPEDAAAWSDKAALLSAVGLRERAIAMLEQATAAGAPSRLLVSLGCALSDVGRYAEAAALFEQCIVNESEPVWVIAALTNRGNALAQMGQHEEAELLHRQAIALQPDDAVLYLNLASGQRQRRAYPDALQTLDEALQQVPPADRARILHQRADLLCTLERAEEALSDIDASLRDGGEHPSKHYVRGWALGLLGRLPEALESMERVLALAPSHAAALRGRAMIREALGLDGDA